MTGPDDTLLDWVVSVAARGARVAHVTGLRDGASPWLISLVGAKAVDVVLRLGETSDAALFATEVAGLQAAGVHDLPAPRLIAADLEGRVRSGTIAVLTTRVPGTSRMTAEPSVGRLRALGTALALVHSVPVPSSPALPPRRHSINGVDFGALRCDAAMTVGLDAADEALAGYEAATGRPADDVAYWDVVAGLSTPPTIDWFVGAIRGQGRLDLDQPTLLARRDAFVEQALDRLS